MKMRGAQSVRNQVADLAPRRSGALLNINALPTNFRFVEGIRSKGGAGMFYPR